MSEIPAGDALASGAAMAGVALASVGLWTLRVALAARGRKLAGAAVAAVEAVVFAVAFSSLAANLDSPARVLGYAVGVAAGTLLGLFLDERGSHGTSEVRLVIEGDRSRVAQTLRGLGWAATSFAAEGPRGPVTMSFVTVDDREVPHVVAALRRSFPAAFWSVQRLRHMHPSRFDPDPAGRPTNDPAPADHRRSHRHIHRRNCHARH